MKAVILAAGFGTRLYPLTEHTPKALLRIGEETILDRLMKKLEPFPVIDQVVLVTNSRFYRQFSEWQVRSEYRKPVRIIENGIYEEKENLGAVRDLDLALKCFRGTAESFLVFCGDNYFDFQLGYFLLPCLGHSRSGFIGLYDVKEKPAASLYGAVETDSHGRVIGFEEKPSEPKSTRVSAGIYYLSAPHRLCFFEYLEIEKRNPDRIGDFIGWLSKKEPLYGVDLEGTWFDIGTLESYQTAQAHAETKGSV